MNNEWSNSLLKAGIKQRELDKNLSFAHFVENEFTLEKYNPIYDLCCGKGILGRYLSEKGYNVVGIDHHHGSKLDKLMLPIPPKYFFYRENLWNLKELVPHSLVLSLHACGSLTDKVIELSINSESDFAVISCCHSDRIYFSPKEPVHAEMAETKGRDYYQDLIRVQFIKEQGYLAGMTTIGINSPKNRIIWGKKR